LPITAYVKMVDIWMILTIVITLVEVSLHTYKETLKGKLRKLEIPTNTTDLFKTRSPIDSAVSLKYVETER
jgi:hypothetical protein